nr:unnamed protein product [Callosobruchus chinensis]
MVFPTKTVKDGYECKMDIPIDESMKDEQESLIYPFSEDGRSDSRSFTGSTNKRLCSSSSDGESNTVTKVSKEQEVSGTHLRFESDSDIEHTTADKIVKKKIRRAFNKHRKHPPKIRESSFMALLETLKSKPKLSKQKQNQMDCVQSLHGSKMPMWTGPTTVLRAVKDCILNRKWNNLTHLLLLMIHFPTNKYKPIIKQASSSWMILTTCVTVMFFFQLCLIIDKYHPVVQENDMTGQFKIVHQATRRTTVTKVEDKM